MENFEIENGILKKYIGSAENVIIPNGITHIGNMAFFECYGLQSAAIPDSVTVICEGAFRDCANLHTLSIGNGLIKIEKEAFCSCEALKNIHLPDSITDIEKNAFFACKSLQNISFGKNLKAIGEMAFCGCKDLQSLTIPKSVISIGEHAFQGCVNLQSIIVESENSVYRSENDCLIKKNNLLLGCPSSVIPNGIKSIASGAFMHCETLESVTIPESVTKIGGRAFYFCEALKELIIPDSVTEIGSEAFFLCKGLKTLTVGNGVTSIGYGAFYGCTGLQNVTIGNHIANIKEDIFSPDTQIQKFAFSPDTNDSEKIQLLLNMFSTENLAVAFLFERIEANAILLKNLKSRITAKKFRERYIPSLIENQDTEIFVKLLLQIKKMDIAEIDTYITLSSEKNALDFKTVLIEYRQKLYPPEKIEKLQTVQIEKELGLREKTPSDYKKIFALKKDDSGYTITKYKDENPSVLIPGNIGGLPVRIQEKAFKGNLKIETVFLEEGVTDIGNYAFSECKNLQNITISETVSEIGESTFLGCVSLQNVTLGNGIKIIAKDAFSSCKSLQEIAIPNGVKLIEETTFKDCSNLQSITLPETVTYIHNHTFYGRQKYITVYAPSDSYAQTYAKKKKIKFQAI